MAMAQRYLRNQLVKGRPSGNRSVIVPFDGSLGALRMTVSDYSIKSDFV